MQMIYNSVCVVMYEDKDVIGCNGMLANAKRCCECSDAWYEDNGCYLLQWDDFSSQSRLW